VNFPANRVQVYAHGEQNPVAPNTTEPGRAQNRRVEVVLGTG
jgi:flagellar motor protein MotB